VVKNGCGGGLQRDRHGPLNQCTVPLLH
jgi:hypothetical protein